MLCDYNANLESKNFVDNVNFTKDDPCIFVVYPPGASGDLLISIIDKHYICTGSEYYGITPHGRVHMYTTDYETIDLTIDRELLFTNQWFHDLAASLGARNLNYSLLDQVIFGCHLRRIEQIQKILTTFKNAKIINIYPESVDEQSLIRLQAAKKIKKSENQTDISHVNFSDLNLSNDARVLNIPYLSLFETNQFEKTYDNIVKFLQLKGKLIRFDYIEYYLSKQSPEFRQSLSNLLEKSTQK